MECYAYKRDEVYPLWVAMFKSTDILVGFIMIDRKSSINSRTRKTRFLKHSTREYRKNDFLGFVTVFSGHMRVTTTIQV